MSYLPKDSDLSHAHFDGVLTDLVFDEVKKDILPNEDIQIPEWELPPTDHEGEVNGESIREREEKWTDLRTNASNFKSTSSK